MDVHCDTLSGSIFAIYGFQDIIYWINVCIPGFQFDTEDGDKVLPGFLDSILGMQRGETKSFQYVFPESWNQEDLRGVQAQFTVSYIY